MMEYLSLARVCQINMGQSPESSSYNEKGDGLPFFQGNADFGEINPVTRVWCSAPTKIAQKDDILISVRAPIGAMNYASEECCIGRGLAAITPDVTNVSSEFIFWLLKSKNAELNSKGTGSTFRAIGKKVLEEVLVPDIPLEQQTECATELNTVYEIIRLRQKQLFAFDTLIKARFVEMFGRVHEEVPLSYYIESLTAGKSLAGEEDCQNKVLKTGAATYDHFDSSQVKNLPKDYEPLPEHQIHDGDIIISRMNTLELVGAAAYVWKAPDHTYLPDRLWRTELKEKVNPIYIWQAIVQPTTKEAIRKTAGGTSGSMKNISKLGLLNLKIKKVSFEEQNAFAAFVSQINKSKVAIQVALDKTQLLFDSLMQKYFG